MGWYLRSLGTVLSRCGISEMVSCYCNQYKKTFYIKIVFDNYNAAIFGATWIDFQVKSNLREYFKIMWKA